MRASLQRGIRYYNQKKYQDALEEFQSLVIDPGSNPEYAYYLGLCNTQLENYEEALLYLEQVVTSDFNVLYVYQSRMVLGYIYTITERYSLAAYEFKQLLEAGYESAQIYSALGFISYSKGKIGESLDYLHKALEVEPDNANAMNSLGFIMAEEGIETEGALNLCKKAVDLKPNNPAYLDSLGWAYFKAGKVQEAKNYLKKALVLSENNKEIVQHLDEVSKKSK